MWEDYYKISTADLGWSPSEFWASTVNEFLLTIKGKEESADRISLGDHMTREEFEELYAKFPDEDKVNGGNKKR